MATSVGEYLVGAHLKLIEECDFVDYNMCPPGGGLRGLNELDVEGIHFKKNTAFLCEVMTHFRGTLYRDNKGTVERVQRKFERQEQYAKDHLTGFDRHVFMFWSPYVPDGYVTNYLGEIQGLDLVINQEYMRRANQLLEKARREKQDAGNPVFRVFQILGALRDYQALRFSYQSQ